MKPNFQTLLKQAGTITALLGGAIASCHFGSPLVATVIGGVLTNILSNKVEQSQLLKIREILSRQNPSNLNHDLEKLSLEALEWATKNICHYYRAYCIKDSERQELASLEKRIIQEIRNINKSQWRAGEEFLSQINDLSDTNNFLTNFQLSDSDWPAINIEFPFSKFYADEFVKNYKLCFGELLKDDNHKPALIAYNRTISTQIQKGLLDQKIQIDALLVSNQELKQKLNAVALSPVEQFEKDFVLPEINIKLDEYLKPLHDEVKLLVSMQGEVLTGIGDLQKESKHQTQQLSELAGKIEELLRNRLGLFLLPVIALLLAFFAYRYWQSTQPFVYTIYVEHYSNAKNLPIKETKVILTYGDKSDTLGGSEVTFKGLPSHLRGEKVQVSVVSPGFSKLDTLIEAENVLNTTLFRDDSYAFMKGRVVDAGTNLPVADVQVMVQDIKTFTDANGIFNLIIPEEKQRVEQRLILNKSGYKPWERENEPAFSTSESIIQLEKL